MSAASSLQVVGSEGEVAKHATPIADCLMPSGAARTAALVGYKPVMILRSERLVLRPLSFDDADSLLPALGDENNMRYWSRAALASAQDVRAYIARNVEAEDGQCFAITLGGGKALGWVACIDRAPKIAELGYILRPDFQRQGIAREAVGLVLDHAFGACAVRRVFADVDPDNRPSIALLQGLGFAYEGRLRATWDTHIGVRDSAIYARLSTDPAPERP